MKRRAFINNSLITGMGLFIPAGSIFSIEMNKKLQTFGDEIMDSNEIIPAPDDPEMWSEWRNSLESWRFRKQKQLKYDGSTYRSESFEWVASNFACCFVMMCDSDFYDQNKNEYTVKKLIERGKSEYGRYDSVVLWHAYPRIGLDDRNQFDFYREVPHGLSGLKDVIKQFHESDVKVFIDYNPWDTGTRRENKPDLELLIDIIRSIDADGIFLDTMRNAPDFRGRLDSVRPGIVMEGEIALPLEDVQSHHMSWAQWFRDSKVPGVYRNKWFEQCHMQHAIARWDSDKSPQLQTAWMNGSGMLIWENIFGQLLAWNDRDKSTYLIMSGIQRHFADLFSGGKWIPLSDKSAVKGVYITCWEKDNTKLWTLINRNEFPAEGTFMKSDYSNKMLYYNLMTGKEISGEVKNGSINFSGKINGRGIGCFLAQPAVKADNSFKLFLSEQEKISSKLSVDISIPEYINKPVRSISIIKHSSPPGGMVAVPESIQEMAMEYNFRECGGYGNIQEHLSFAPTHKLHSVCVIKRNVIIRRFAIDETPVTNSQFKDFLTASGYKPRIAENFLKHWNDGEIPSGLRDHPVVYIDLGDAMAYAKWAGKRLPTEEEWQSAAQGPERSTYPWGNEMEKNKCNINTNGLTTPVGAFPSGVSSYGCLDMCGNTWELTANEYSDGRTRFVMLKGGSCYKAEGSQWYMDGGPQKNSFIAKMLLMYPGLDRCPVVGFRCAVDL